MNIAQLRKDTPGSENLIHFNNAGASLMPKPVVDAIRNYLTEEEYKGGYETAAAAEDRIQDFFVTAARALHCYSRNIAFTTSATDSYNRALSSIPFRQGDVILLSANDYPSNYIVLLSLQKRFGIKIVTIQNSPTGEIDLADLEQKIRTHSPRLVSISHIPTSSGLVQPITAIGKIIRKYDTLYLLDACQSFGQMDVDVLETRADFVSGTFRKFLRGPRGAGLLYVSDKALASGLEPLFLDIRGATWTAKDTYESRPDARRFEDWETAYALLMGSREALKYMLSIGIDAIETRNALLSSRLRAGLSAIEGIRVLDRGEKLCNIITFSTAGLTKETALPYFYKKGINVSIASKSAAIMDFEEKGLEWAIRASPHYYNTEVEIDAFLDAVRQL
jgi:selenocysteine lyase/cysteine desulfurase